MTPDDRTRLAPPADDQLRALAGRGDTVDRPTDGTRSGVRVVGADAADPSATVVRVTESHDGEHAPPAFEHYQLLGELGRGGMGVVYRALDTRLKRDVAIKVLAGRMVGNPTAERRFLEEALVTGQLTHTAIPPVHELGTLPDGRQFLVMKLINGSTLGEQLKARPDPSADLSDHLGALEQVCLGVGYAHSRGVIHRDLKPANIMVGAFREVLVMDWGLAKELRTADRLQRENDTAFAVGSEPPPAGADGLPADTLREVRAESEDVTRAGTILGTPPYMSPEQATGDVEGTDARTDVFSLGAILCVILTGHPPYQGKTTNDVVRKAMACDTADAFRRLGHSTADPALIGLCKRCLAKDPAKRPANGKMVAAELSEIRASAVERLRRADLAEMARMTRLRESKRRRQVQFALVVALVCLVVLIGYAVWYLDDQNQKSKDAEREKLVAAAEDRASRQRADDEAKGKEVRRLADEENTAKLKGAEREAAIEAALAQAITALWEAHFARAEAAWDAALERARVSHQLAQVRLKEDPSSEIAPRVKQVGEKIVAATKQRQLAVKLDDIASTFLEREQISDRNVAFADRYNEAFRDAGYSERDPVGFVKQVNEHPTPATLIEAVFDWHFHALTDRRYTEDTATLRGVLTPLLDKLVADHPFLAKWWAAQKDASAAGTKAMLELAATREAGQQNAAVTHRMFVDLWNRREREVAIRLMRDGLVRYPSDYRLHARFALHLGVLNTPAANTEALAHATAAVALRPKSVNANVLLGHLMVEQSGDLNDALRYLDKAVELDRGMMLPRIERAAVLVRLNRPKEAEADYAVINKVDLNGDARLKAVQARWVKGAKEEKDAAVAELRAKVAPTVPKALHAQMTLARVCKAMSLPDDATTAYRAAIAASPRWANAQVEFGQYLIELKEWQAAVKLLTQTADDFPGDWRGPSLLAQVAAAEKKWAEAIRQADSAVKRDKNNASLWNELGNYHAFNADPTNAVKAYTEALARDPDNAVYHRNIAGQYTLLGDKRALEHLSKSLKPSTPPKDKPPPK